jgi:hypothetical protein
MKSMNCHKAILLCLLLIGVGGFAQDSAKKELLLDVKYFMPANRVPYVTVQAKTKIEKRFQPVAGVVCSVYLDSVPQLLGKVVTDARGDARVVFFPAVKNSWDASAVHTFIAVSGATKQFDETTAEISVTKSKMVIDTLADADVRTVKARVFQLSNNEWVPAGDVELKLGVRRLGGDLPISDEETYTTDSTGEVQAEFKKEKLPGDSAGNIILVARVDDNEQLGNLSAEIKLPWGVPSVVHNTFDQRALWATRNKAPGWLLFMAGTVISIVWGTILFLLWQVGRIRRLGKSYPQ